MIHVHQLELKFGVVPDSKLSVCKSRVSHFTENEPFSTCVILIGNCLLLRSQWWCLFLCSSLSRGATNWWTVYEAFTNIKIISQAKFDTLDLWVSKWSFFSVQSPTVYVSIEQYPLSVSLEVPVNLTVPWTKWLHWVEVSWSVVAGETRTACSFLCSLKTTSSFSLVQIDYLTSLPAHPPGTARQRQGLHPDAHLEQRPHIELRRAGSPSHFIHARAAWGFALTAVE